MPGSAEFINDKFKTGPLMPLNRESVLKAALELLNEVGMDALTTRKLGERLGVQSPALYWHFQNKRALLDAMSARIAAGMEASEHPRPGQAWSDWLIAHCHDFRRVLLAHRDGARLHAGTRPDPAQLPNIEAHMGVMCQAGFDPGEALMALMAVGRFVVGWVLEEQESAGDRRSPAEGSLGKYPLLARGVSSLNGGNSDKAFDFGLMALIEGFRQKMR